MRTYQCSDRASAPNTVRPVAVPPIPSARSTVVGLYALYFANYAVSFLIIPYVSRVLGPEAMGKFAFSQAYGQWIFYLVEFGFNYHAAAIICHLRGSKVQCGDIVTNVVAAKALLSFAAVLLTAIGWASLPAFRQAGYWLILGLLWGVCQASSLIWYFQGAGRLRNYAIADVAIKSAGAVAVLCFVKHPRDGWLVFVIQSFAGLAIIALSYRWLRRDVTPTRPTMADTWALLRQGCPFFIFRFLAAAASFANPLIMGLFTSGASVGYFSCADKLVRLLAGLTIPLNEGVYPKLATLARTGRYHTVRKSTNLMVGVGGLMGLAIAIALYFSSDTLVRFIYGYQYAPTAAVLRIMSAVPLFTIVSQGLGTQVLLPLGQKTLFSAILAGTFCVTILLAGIGVRAQSAAGMGGAVLASQALGLILMGLAAHHCKSMRRATAEVE